MAWSSSTSGNTTTFKNGSISLSINTEAGSNSFNNPTDTALVEFGNKLNEIENLVTSGATPKEISKKIIEARNMLKKGQTAYTNLENYEKQIYTFGEKSKDRWNAMKHGVGVAAHGVGIAANVVTKPLQEMGEEERKHLNFTVPQLDAGIKALDEAIERCTDPRLMQKLQTQQKKYINAKHFINTHYKKAFNNVMKEAAKQGMVTETSGKYYDAEGKEITVQEFAQFKNIITVNMIKNPGKKMDTFKNALAGVGKVLGTGRDLVNDHRKLVAGTGIAIASALTISNFMDYTTAGGATVGDVVKQAITEFFKNNPKLKAALNVLAITGLVIGVAAAAEKTNKAMNKAAQRKRTMDGIQEEISESQEKADKAATAPIAAENSLRNDLENKVKLTPEQIERIADDPNLYKHLKDLTTDKSVKPSVKAYAIKTLAEVDAKRAEFSNASKEVKAQKAAKAAEQLRQKNIDKHISNIIGTHKDWASVESERGTKETEWKALCGCIDANYGTNPEKDAEIEKEASNKIKQQININMQRSNS